MKDVSQQHWLVKPSSIKILWRVGLCVLSVLVLSDLIIHTHTAFGIDGSFGFYSWYGLLTCFAMIVFAKLLGFFLKRKDTYYDD